MRIRMVGISKPEIVNPLAKSRLDTSGATLSRIAPLWVMLGVNLSRTPNSRNVIVTAWVA